MELPILNYGEVSRQRKDRDLRAICHKFKIIYDKSRNLQDFLSKIGASYTFKKFEYDGIEGVINKTGKNSILIELPERYRYNSGLGFRFPLFYSLGAAILVFGLRLDEAKWISRSNEIILSPLNLISWQVIDYEATIFAETLLLPTQQEIEYTMFKLAGPKGRVYLDEVAYQLGVERSDIQKLKRKGIKLGIW
jgi:hypothetical protein